MYITKGKMLGVKKKRKKDTKKRIGKRIQKKRQRKDIYIYKKKKEFTKKNQKGRVVGLNIDYPTFLFSYTFTHLFICTSKFTHLLSIYTTLQLLH
jgi:hypothetical protein